MPGYRRKNSLYLLYFTCVCWHCHIFIESQAHKVMKYTCTCHQTALTSEARNTQSIPSTRTLLYFYFKVACLDFMICMNVPGNQSWVFFNFSSWWLRWFLLKVPWYIHVLGSLNMHVALLNICWMCLYGQLFALLLVCQEAELTWWTVE